MPELPEVETIVIGLNKLVRGASIKDVSYDWPKSFRISDNLLNNSLKGARIVDVKRRAKVIIIALNSGYSLLIHLKMTGQVVYESSKSRFGAGHPNDSLISALPDKSTRVIFTLRDDDGRLYFNDQRKFGWIKLVKSTKVPEDSFIKKLGPEPLDKAFNYSKFKARILTRSNSNIKAVLLDQTILAGLGNIYVDESLFFAKIHPLRKVQSLSNLEIKLLLKSIKTSLLKSLDLGGSTNRNYVNAEGQKGKYLDFAYVYNRAGQNCLVCRSTISKIRVAGRGTHICLVCQVI